MSGSHVLPFESLFHCIADRLSTYKGHDIVFIFVEVSYFEFTNDIFHMKNGTLVSKKIPFSFPVFYYRKVLIVKKMWIFFQIAQICSLYRGSH